MAKLDKKILAILGIVLILALGLLAGVLFLLQKNEPQNQGVSEFDPANLQWEQIMPVTAFWSPRDAHTVVAFKNKMFLYGGIEGGQVKAGNTPYGSMAHMSDIWVTEDGKNWELATDKSKFKDRRSLGLAILNNVLYAMGGWENIYGGPKHDVWKSDDGVSWDPVLTNNIWPAREGHGTAVLDGKIWVAGGVDFLKSKTYNDVWYSSDGKNWTEATAAAPWGKRYDLTLSAFDGKLWVIGGLDFGDNVTNDVWYSSDGKNWTEVKDIPFQPRHGHITLEYKGYLFVIAGWNEGAGGLNDVWYSSDGVVWKKTKRNPPFYGREDLGGDVFDNKLWIMGGMTDHKKEWVWQNDVWSAGPY